MPEQPNLIQLILISPRRDVQVPRGDYHYADYPIFEMHPLRSSSPWKEIAKSMTTMEIRTFVTETDSKYSPFFHFSAKSLIAIEKQRIPAVYGKHTKMNKYQTEYQEGYPINLSKA